MVRLNKSSKFNNCRVSVVNMKKQGFTLIEVVIVIALIGILSSVLVPAYEKAGERAKNAKLISDMQVLDSALILYQLDKGQLPATLQELAPEYIAGTNEYHDARNLSLTYTVGEGQTTYKLKGQNAKNQEVYSNGSTK